jgi:ribosome-binding factor A
VSGIRQKQIAEMIRRHFSIVLQDQGSYLFDSQPLVTVTAVRMTPDMGLAKIYLSVYNTDNKQAVILQMQEEKSRLKQSLGLRLRKHMRRIPDIDFYLDDTLDEMYRLNDLFDKLHTEGQMGEEE